ncbi:MAG: hypothetical protein J5972_02355 [Eubacterium sp.]|nr:hypothetical protein [Eubacterium sp.]
MTNLSFYVIVVMMLIIILFPILAIATKKKGYYAAMLFVLAGMFLIASIYLLQASMFRIFAWVFLGLAVGCIVGGVCILKCKKKS